MANGGGVLGLNQRELYPKPPSAASGHLNGRNLSGNKGKGKYTLAPIPNARLPQTVTPQTGGSPGGIIQPQQQPYMNNRGTP